MYYNNINKQFIIRRQNSLGRIGFDYKKAIGFLEEQEITSMKESVKLAHDMLHNKTGAGNDFLGWVNIPTDYD